MREPNISIMFNNQQSLWKSNSLINLKIKTTRHKLYRLDNQLKFAARLTLQYSNRHDVFLGHSGGVKLSAETSASKTT